MRWQEFEAITRKRLEQRRADEAGVQARAKAEKEAEEAALRKEQERLAKEKAAEKEQAFLKKLDRTQELLKDYNVAEILHGVRDDLWEKEGKIEDRITRDRVIGLSLVSDPYLIVRQGGRYDLDLFLDEERTAFEVIASEDLDGLRVRDRNVYNVKDWKTVSVTGAVKESRLAQAIHDATDPQNWTIHAVSRNMTSWANSEAGIDVFNAAVIEHVDMRREFESFPKDIRKRTDEVVSELPASLRISRSIHSNEVRRWAHEVKGSTPIYRAADHLARKAGIFLPL